MSPTVQVIVIIVIIIIIIVIIIIIIIIRFLMAIPFVIQILLEGFFVIMRMQIEA